MNTYGQQAMTHWRQRLPGRYAAIPDPEAFFTELGEQAAAQIEQLADKLADSDPPGETYMNKLGRLNAARQRATELVVRELILPDPGPDEAPTAAPPTAGQETQPAGSDESWIPVVEDPTHPYWAGHDR
ncbi:MAG: hypothetical protein AB7I38_11870 [Dehalococcoidia bacterium]